MLTEWLQEDALWQPAYTTPSPIEETAATKKAVKAMGSKALPTLIGFIQAKDEPMKSKLTTLINEYHPFDFRLYTVGEKHDMAIKGFEMLEQDALAAVPALIKLVKDRDKQIRRCALVSLVKINPDKDTLLPILLALLNDQERSINDPNQTVGWDAANYLNGLYPNEAEKAGINKILYPSSVGALTNDSSTIMPVGN